MNKAELISSVAAQTGETKTAVARVIESLTATIREADKVVLVGFGTFARKVRAARTGRNPATGGTVEIPAKTVLAFKASKLND